MTTAVLNLPRMGDSIIETVADLLTAVIEGIADGIESAEGVEELWGAFRTFRTDRRRNAARSAAIAASAAVSDPLAQMLAIVERHAGRLAAEELRERISSPLVPAGAERLSDAEVDELILRAQENARRIERQANFVATMPVLAPRTGRARHRAPHPSDDYESNAA